MGVSGIGQTFCKSIWYCIKFLPEWVELVKVSVEAVTVGQDSFRSGLGQTFGGSPFGGSGQD